MTLLQGAVPVPGLLGGARQNQAGLPRRRRRGLPDTARRVIQRSSNPRFKSQMSSYDVTIAIQQSGDFWTLLAASSYAA